MTLLKTIAEIRALMEKATPGPWQFDDSPGNQLVDSATRAICALPGIVARTDDFKFIAALRNAAPDLLKAAVQNKRLRIANTALANALDRIRDVLLGDEFMAHADKGIHQIVNDALKLNEEALRGCDDIAKELT